jgi:acylphosphatase
MAKARIVVEGTVQGTGYRALVKSFANREGVTGLVRNLVSGKVEVFCDGPRGGIEWFVKDIDVKGNPSNALSLYVEKIDVSWEGDNGFEQAWKAYSGFEIDYGVENLTAFQRENLESLEWAKLHFSMLENGIYSFRDNTQANFSAMEKKYDVISTDVKSTELNLTNSLNTISSEVKSTKLELTNSLNKLPDRIGEAVTKHLKAFAKE